MSQQIYSLPRLAASVPLRLADHEPRACVTCCVTCDRVISRDWMTDDWMGGRPMMERERVRWRDDRFPAARCPGDRTRTRCWIRLKRLEDPKPTPDDTDDERPTPTTDDAAELAMGLEPATC